MKTYMNVLSNLLRNTINYSQLTIQKWFMCALIPWKKGEHDFRVCLRNHHISRWSHWKAFSFPFFFLPFLLKMFFVVLPFSAFSYSSIKNTAHYTWWNKNGGGINIFPAHGWKVFFLVLTVKNAKEFSHTK